MGKTQKYLMVAFLLVSFITSAQQEKIDSLISEIRQKKEEATKMKLVMVEAKLHQQNLIIISFVITSLCGVSITLALYKSGKRTRIKNILLHEQNCAIQHQNKAIQSQKEVIVKQADDLKVSIDFLEEKNRRIQEINAEREELISIVAYDLRASINRNKGLSRILLQTKLTEDQREIVNLLLQVNEDGSQIIQNILQANSTSYKKPESSSIYLHHFIRDCVENVFNKEALRKNIRIHIAI